MELQNKLLLFLGHGGLIVSEVARIQVNSVQCTRFTLHSLEAVVGRTINKLQLHLYSHNYITTTNAQGNSIYTGVVIHNAVV